MTRKLSNNIFSVSGQRMLVFTLLAIIHSCTAACYFSIELQGEFVMQSTVNHAAQVQYSQVNITAEAIPIWGHCHRRIGNNVILMDSSGGANCIHCFHVTLRSRNVVEVRTEGLGKCYTNEEAARATCPQPNSLQHSQQILLYKTKDLGGKEIRQEYCPINGRFTFIYNVNDGSENNVECPYSVSELDNCPSGSRLNLRFRQCSFDNHDITFECLGDWVGPGNQRYLALLDTRVMSDTRPQYRCALYREDPGTGNIYMAFSSDSTCSTALNSATNGYETLNLTTVRVPNWPYQVVTSNYRFPSWAQGHWQHMYVEGNTLTYKNHDTYKTYTFRCLSSDSSSSERYLVFGRSQCGEEMYTCIWLKKRGTNVLEFQLGDGSQSSSYNNSLCDDFNFRPNNWITQGKLERLQESPCPISGEYTGFIPDVTGLCAKLSSDCKSPEVMYYTVSDCSQNEVYEEREYRCLGQWEEDGRMYTYTQRRDVDTYECFVGTIVSDSEIYIKEAGEHCQRGVDPLHNGMKLSRKGPCFGNEPATRRPQHSQPVSTNSWYNKHLPSPEPTKPWKPITAPPRNANGAQNSAMQLTVLTLSMCVVLGHAFNF